MERWKKQIEYWLLYLFFLIICVLSLAGRQNDKFILLMFAMVILSSLIFFCMQRETSLEKIKKMMDKRRIRPIHLWIGLIVIYYGMIGVIHLVGNFD